VFVAAAKPSASPLCRFSILYTLLRADASIGPYTKTKIAAALFPGSRDFFIAYTIFSSAGGLRS
ncbi:MAG: hypothetical protein UE643_09320, partial [Gemmiger sp.]|nr:hypothetical protein [Gemmiger sp.]